MQANNPKNFIDVNHADVINRIIQVIILNQAEWELDKIQEVLLKLEVARVYHDKLEDDEEIHAFLNSIKVYLIEELDFEKYLNMSSLR